MTFTEMALRLLPMWIAGILMIIVVLKSEYKSIMRIELTPVLKWIRFMTIISAIRIGAFLIAKYSGLDMSWLAKQGAAVNSIPWQGILGVFWEDAIHGLPLALMALMLPQKWWSKSAVWAATAMVMISFGSGHLYQGLASSLLIMLYIPVSIKYGNKNGFGTVMLCHTIYDLFTIFVVKWMLGNL